MASVKAGDRIRVERGDLAGTGKDVWIIVDRVAFGMVSFHGEDDASRGYQQALSDVEYRLSLSPASKYAWVREETS